VFRFWAVPWLGREDLNHEHSLDHSHRLYCRCSRKLITPGRNELSGFILTTVMGIVGAFVATYLGQALGWYAANEGAGLIGATVGAVLVLLVWGAIAAGRRGVT
jgi:uncharacterized membrane protein YeaQ/YmgE (transglycosylase-associated protein family)